MLEVRGLAKSFVKRGIFGPDRRVDAVKGVSFSVKKGKTLVLAGQSGSGKSTIARLILGSIQADAGEVILGGQRADLSSKGGARAVRAACQMVHQDPYDSVDPRMRALDVVMEPLEAQGGMDRPARMRRAREALAEARLDPKEIGSKHPHMLSGGQRQRVVLARALAVKPSLIIADEPVSMLDVSVRAELLETMSQMQRQNGISFLYITHDLATASHFGDEIAVLYAGKIVESGPAADVLSRPVHPYTQALVDAVPSPDPSNLARKKTVRINAEPTQDAGGCIFRQWCPYAIPKCASEPPLEPAGEGRLAACFVPPGQRAGDAAP